MDKIPVSQKTKNLVNRATTVATVATGAALASGVTMAADGDIELGSVGVAGLAVAAAGVFAIKAAPKFLMWGYGQLLSFIKR